jgi:hypothetical protein
MPLVVMVDAARWWGPVGWGYRNLPGNLTASGVCFVAGFVAGRTGLKHLHAKLDAHHAEHMRHIKHMNKYLGLPEAPHHPDDAPSDAAPLG